MTQPVSALISAQTSTTVTLEKTAIASACAALSPPVTYTPSNSDSHEKIISALILALQGQFTQDNWNANADANLYLSPTGFSSVGTKTDNSSHYVQGLTVYFTSPISIGYSPDTY